MVPITSVPENRHLCRSVNAAAVNNVADSCDFTYVNVDAIEKPSKPFISSAGVVSSCTTQSSVDTSSQAYTDSAADHYINMSSQGDATYVVPNSVDTQDAHTYAALNIK